MRDGIWNLRAGELVVVGRSHWTTLAIEDEQDDGVGQATLLKLHDPHVPGHLAKNVPIQNLVHQSLQLQAKDARWSRMLRCPGVARSISL